MKKILLLTVIALLPVSIVLAQDKDRDASIKESIEAQKKAALEERRVKDVPRVEDFRSLSDSTGFERDNAELDSLRREAWADVHRAWDEASKTSQEAMREYGDVFQQAIEMARNNYDENDGYSRFYSSFGMGGDFMLFNESERTSWDFSKTMIENTFSSSYSFDVDAGATTFVLSVSGDCRSGVIKVEVITPTGSSYANLSIDEFGNLNWRKTFNLSDSVNSDKAGSWSFNIDTSEATGHFKISAQTF